SIGGDAVEVEENGVGGQDRIAFRSAAAGKPPEADQQKQAAQEDIAVDRDQPAKGRTIQQVLPEQCGICPERSNDEKAGDKRRPFGKGCAGTNTGDAPVEDEDKDQCCNQVDHVERDLKGE